MQDEVSLFLKETRLQSITGYPISSKKSFESPWPLYNAKLCLKKKKKAKKLLTNTGTAGLVNSAGCGRILALHMPRISTKSTLLHPSLPKVKGGFLSK